MTLGVEVIGAGLLPDELAAIGVPVVAGADGPALAPGLPGGLVDRLLPEGLDRPWCKRQGFAAKRGQTLTLQSPSGGPVTVLLGLGSPSELDAEAWRKASAGLVRYAGEGGAGAIVLPGAQSGSAPDPATLGSALAEGAVLAAYRFDEFRSTERPGSVERLLVVSGGDEAADRALADGTRRGVLVAAAVCEARDLVNTPPSDLPPRRFAERIGEWLAPRGGVTVTVWDEGRIASERLGGLLGVSRGSAEPPRLVRADYRPADTAGDPGAPHVVLVGKGITFDSGGLSLKTAEGMTTMKTDMSGAAIVLAVVAACADLALDARVTAIAPITENMPGGRALKPGDVLTIRNGATIEVLNTDAEGRLVLADGLVLATELEPSAIIDVATLTGAAVSALGSSIAAVFGNDEGLVGRVRRSGARAGESFWPLPLAEEYADHIDSEIADMKNIGKAGQAGAISAALLLARFVGDRAWAHLDIAGPARAPEATGYLSKGGTAFGVRTLVDLLSSYDTA